MSRGGRLTPAAIHAEVGYPHPSGGVSKLPYLGLWYGIFIVSSFYLFLTTKLPYSMPPDDCATRVAVTTPAYSSLL
ncbi:hypothetical protein J6590_033031 [Homalodisca vitripennis]|nr:hypothetical protein J6590_033031 [Homalodisca vitripennis]